MMNLEKLVDRMFVRTIYWENIYHCCLIKITTYKNRIKPNRIKEYVWANEWGKNPKLNQIDVYKLEKI